MVDPRFYPMPTRPKHHILRWVLLILHITPFAAIVLGHDALMQRMPELVSSNILHIGLPIWGGLIVIHLLIVLILDAWESIVFTMRENERMHAYEEHHRKGLR